MSEQWSVPHGTVYEDKASGLRVEFFLTEFGSRVLKISRFVKGIPGLVARDLVFNAEGEHTGSGSSCCASDFPLNPDVTDDDADAWKR